MHHIGDALRAEEQGRLRAMVQETSERRACEALGIPRSTFARALAGLRLQRGTVALIRARLTTCAIPDPGPRAA